MPIQKQNVTLFLPALGILALYLFTRLFSMESGLEETAAALLGFGALACFAHGERLASDPARSLKQSIFWGFWGAVLPFISTELVLYQNLEILTQLFGEVLLPLLVVTCVVTGALGFLWRSGRVSEDKKKRWHLWLFLGHSQILCKVH